MLISFFFLNDQFFLVSIEFLPFFLLSLLKVKYISCLLSIINTFSSFVCYGDRPSFSESTLFIKAQLCLPCWSLLVCFIFTWVIRVVNAFHFFLHAEENMFCWTARASPLSLSVTLFLVRVIFNLCCTLPEASCCLLVEHLYHRCGQSDYVRF